MSKWLKGRPLSVYAALAVALCFSGYQGARNFIVHAQAGATIHVQPYVIERWLTNYAARPEGQIESKTLMVRRSDGTSAKRVLATLVGPGTSRHRELALLDGRLISINDDEGVRTTMRLSDLELAQLKDRLTRASHAQATGCRDPLEVSVGRDTIAGYEVRGWSREAMASTGLLYRTTWYRAPELGCAVLKEVREERQLDGTYHKKWEDVAQYALAEEPSASETESGDSYREVPPSEFARLTYRTADLTHKALSSDWCKEHDCSKFVESEKRMDKIDEMYRKRQ